MIIWVTVLGSAILLLFVKHVFFKENAVFLLEVNENKMKNFLIQVHRLLW